MHRVFGWVVVLRAAVYGADGGVYHPHRTHHLHSGSQDHHPSKNSVHKVMVNSNGLISTTIYDGVDQVSLKAMSL